MKTVKKLLLTALGTAIVALSTGKAEATTVTLKAEGFDSMLNSFFGQNDFFELSFVDSPDDVFIDKFTLDLSREPDAFFDFGGGFFSQGSFGTPPQLGSNSDISAAEITNVSLTNNKQTFTVNFADAAFGVGETLEFGVDTDLVGPMTGFWGFIDPGGAFGLADIMFSVEL